MIGPGTLTAYLGSFPFGQKRLSGSLLGTLQLIILATLRFPFHTLTPSFLKATVGSLKRM